MAGLILLPFVLLFGFTVVGLGAWQERVFPEKGRRLPMVTIVAIMAVEIALIAGIFVVIFGKSHWYAVFSVISLLITGYIGWREWQEYPSGRDISLKRAFLFLAGGFSSLIILVGMP